MSEREEPKPDEVEEFIDSHFVFISIG